MTDENRIKLAKASSYMGNISYANPWSADQYDRLDTYDLKEYQKVVNDCRFFYKRDPIASTTLNKLVDIGITNIIVDQGTLSDNEYRIIKALLPELQSFMQLCALEYLISGLVVPEYDFTAATKIKLQNYGIKRYDSLLLPEIMWVRDSSTITINQSLIPSNPSYFLKIPGDIRFFILNKGVYPDGTKDEELYRMLAKLYPEMVKAILDGEIKIKLNNSNIIRRRYLSDSPYPIPYLYPALESLKHKRNIRRMDYSIAARVQGAIQLITLGSDEFPLTEDEEDAFTNIRDQLRHRDRGSDDLERVYQLFGNHTLKIQWIFPDVTALLDEKKYTNVNNDIIYSLGMPRILITGETERTGTSSPEWATLSPIRTMKEFRDKLIVLAETIITDTLEKNKIKGRPLSIRFDNINLHEFAKFVEALIKLYETGNVSRTTMTDVLGFNFMNELDNIEIERAEMEKRNIPDFPQTPYSPPPVEEKPKDDTNTNENLDEEDINNG